MDSTENEALPSNSSGSASINRGGELVNGAAVVRGKRTKRPRNQSPLPVLALAAAADSSASSSEATPNAGGAGLTKEEEDMANCLILLAQGRVFFPSATASASASAAVISPESPKASPPAVTEKFTSRRFTEAATTNGKAGFYVYECKTCNKCFPSFQALGGHRTSHKKPKLSSAAVAPHLAADDDMLRMINSNYSRAAAAAGKAAKVHECSICGSEFSSGQALGGHMRRHRPLSGAGPPPVSEEAKKNKQNNFLSLDLNLPAPSAGEDDLQRPPSPTTLSLAGGNRTLLLPAPPVVVDCHY